MCAKCKKGGELVECDTCSQSMHPGCDNQMSTNVWQKNAAYQCPCCQRGNVSEKIYATESEEEIHQPQKTYKQKSSYVEIDSEDDNQNEHIISSNNTPNNKTRTNTPKIVETRGEGENKDETITLNNITTNEPLQHSTSKPDRTGFNVESDSDEEDTSTNDPTQTTKNAGAPSKRKPGKLGKHSGRDKNTKQNKVTVETECEQGENKEETTTPNNTNENRPQQQQTQREKVHQQNTLKFDQTRTNVEADSDKEDTCNNDPNLTTINTDEPRKRKLGKSTHDIHDKDVQGCPTLGIPI